MDLKELRKEIDKIDEIIIDQFEKRMELSEEIAEYKRERDLPVRDEAREAEKLEKVCAMAQPDMATYCKMLYNNILEISRDYQRKVMKRGEDMVGSLVAAFDNTPEDMPSDQPIACHGGQEPYCRQACIKLFGNDEHIQYFEELPEIFEALVKGECRYAVITIGKQIEVSNRVYELLAENNCYITRSVMTAGGIRFVCVSKELEIYQGADRTGLMLRIPDVPGALYGVLDKFYALGLNVSKLKSWTAPDNEDDLMFCFDVEVPFESEAFRNMMNQVDHAEQEYVYLGSYMEIKNE